jgi:hypothetical protein
MECGNAQPARMHRAASANGTERTQCRFGRDTRIWHAAGPPPMAMMPKDCS